MLAGAQIVGDEVRARAEILAEAGSADGDAITTTALWVGHGEFGENRLAAQVFEQEGLLTAELPAQRICQSSTDSSSGRRRRDSLGWAEVFFWLGLRATRALAGPLARVMASFLESLKSLATQADGAL